MWLEAVFSLEDLQSVLADFAPLNIRVGADADHHIELSDVRDVSLVAAVGLRVSCRAVVHWPVVGLHVPVRIEPLTVLLKPTVTPGEQGDTLAFKLEIENADFAHIPSVVDRGITGKLNHELTERHAELSWNFASALSHVFELPHSLEPVDGVDLQVRWGKIRVTEEAMVMAVSFRPKVLRHGESLAPRQPAPLARPGNGAIVPLRPHAPVPLPVVVAAGTGLALGVLLGVGAAKRAWI